MELNKDPFPVGMVEFEHKKILVRTDQVETTKGKNVVISDDLRNQMIKPHNPEIGLWEENVQRKQAKLVKPMLAMLIEKNQWPLEGSNGIDSSRPGTDLIYRRHGVVGSLREGRHSTLQIGNPR
jgi:hypothetical protein